MATSTPKQKPSTKSNTSKRTSLKASSKFDIRIIALLAVLLVAVVGYLFIRFSKAGTGTQWLPKAWTNQATEFDSPAAGTLVAGTCDYVNDYVQNGIQYTKRVCTPVGVSAGVGGKTAFQLPDNTYIVGKPSKYVDLQHKVPASLASPSEYCISYSSMKPIYLKWNNKTVPSSPDYVVGGVAGNDSATLPATNGVVSEWCSGPYPANPGGGPSAGKCRIHPPRFRGCARARGKQHAPAQRIRPAGRDAWHGGHHQRPARDRQCAWC
mgnify:CR=1 FL=1